MLYHIYRPKRISDIDNTAPRESISSLLLSSVIPHAFLLIGQKGTGKTSSARIIAKALNCPNKKGESPEPCNTCATCLSIDASSFPDVTELDAASNRGINEVKELIAQSALLPLAGKRRVYIIDEAHMITPDAFNALLKTLEEPAASTVFILATTNREKVPATIQSRCVVVNFGLATPVDIRHMLDRIVKGEKLTVPAETLDFLSLHCENSFRDATKLFEELVTTGDFSLTQLKKILGIAGKGNLLEQLSAKDPSKALSWVSTYYAEGGSMKVLLEQELQRLRMHLLTLNAVPGYSSTLSLTLPQTVKLLKLFSEAYEMMRVTPIESIPVEISITEFYN